MSDTLPNIPLNANEWVDLYAQSIIPVGVQVIMYNNGDSDIYYTVSSVQPSLSNTAYKVMRPRDLPVVLGINIAGLWGLSPTDNGKVNIDTYIPVDLQPQRSAFGEAMIAQMSPILQITAQYGLLNDVITAALGGSVSTIDSKFSVSTGVGANNVAAIVSSREAQYKAGQGLSCRITALFTEGQPDSTQQAGLITSESAFVFGYNGDEFGILHSFDGQLENQELTITTGAAGSENADITVDGFPLSVPLTSGSAEFNAYEIAIFLDANRPGYGFTSNGNKVIALAQLPDFGAGLWDFTSATAIASWLEIKDGMIPTEFWTPKDQWNVNPTINIDPSLGNVYQIQIQYLGFGGIRFFVENPINAELELVHIIRYANTSLVPSVSNPIFRIGWAVRNKGNTTDIVVQGSSGVAYIEGIIEFDGIPNGASQNQPNVGMVRTNVLGIRNRTTFNETANRAEIIPQLLSLATDTNKIAVFEVVQDPIVSSSDFLEWQYIDETISLMETSTTPAIITGGKVVASFNVTIGGIPPIDMQKVLKYQSPGVTYSISALVVGSGNLANMAASLTWQEDL